MRNANGHEPIARRTGTFLGCLFAEPCSELQRRTRRRRSLELARRVFSFPDLLVAHYGGQFLICPIPDTGSGFGGADPAPGCAAADLSNPLRKGYLSLTNMRILLAGEGLFDDPVRDLTDIRDGGGNFVTGAQVLGRGSGVTDPFRCARQ